MGARGETDLSVVNLIRESAVEMIRSYGLIHIGLAVRDAERSFRFYEQVLGLREMYREAGTIDAA